MLKDISAKSAQKRKNRKRNRDGKIKGNNQNQNQRQARLNKGGPWDLSSTAASYEVSLSNPTAFEFVKGGGVAHKEWGGATRIRGRQQLITLVTDASTSNLFVSGLGTVDSANTISVGPYQFGDRVAYIGAMFQRYAFRKLRFIYVTRVGTTQVGCFAMAYTTDGGSDLFPVELALTYGTVQSIDPCRIVPFRKEFDCLDVSYSGDRTWFVDIGNINSEGARQSNQGVLWGFPDVSSIGAVNQGEIYVEYELDFYVPAAADVGITLLRGLGKKFSSQVVKLAKKLSTVSVTERQIIIDKLCSFLVFMLEKMDQINKTPQGGADRISGFNT